jgi:hypothetical protein
MSEEIKKTAFVFAGAAGLALQKWRAIPYEG